MEYLWTSSRSLSCGRTSTMTGDVDGDGDAGNAPVSCGRSPVPPFWATVSVDRLQYYKWASVSPVADPSEIRNGSASRGGVYH